MSDPSRPPGSVHPAPSVLSRFLALGVELVLPLILYLTLAFWNALIHAERINPDGICYARLAKYLVAGDFQDAISTYWSPLFAWSMAPLLMLGVDALNAASVVQVLWGAGLLLAFHWFLTTWTDLGSWARALTMLLLVLPLVDYANFVVAPDVALAACLLSYFAALGDPQWRSSRIGLLGIGILGGGAYWTKAYALPFVLIHLPLTILAFGAPARMTRRLRDTAIAFLGLAIPVALWVSALTWQHGSLTLGTSGPINHAVVGPPDVLRYHPVVFGVPSPPHISVWETPEKLPYKFWSPFQSRAYFQYQLGIIRDNAGRMARVLGNFDALRLSAILFVLLLPLGWWLKHDARTRTLLWWTAATILVYLSGYLFVAFEPRYANSLILPLLVAAGLQMVLAPTRNLPNLGRLLIVATVAGSLAWTWVPLTRQGLTQASPSYMRALADSLPELNFRGPFATTSWYHGVALAFCTDQPTVGFPPDASPEVCAERLREAGVNWIVVWDMPFYPPQPVQDLYPPTIPRATRIVQEEPGWKLQRAVSVPFRGREARIYFYQRMNSIAP